MAELTPRDDVKKTVSEILKRVDQLLKAGTLDEAKAQIDKAREVDPKNVYVFAYEERLAAMVEDKKKKDAEAAQRKAEEEKRRREEESRRKAEEQRRAEEEAKRKAAEEQRRKEDEKRKEEEAERRRKEDEARSRVAAAGPAVPDVPRSVVEETKRKIMEERRSKGSPPSESVPGTFRNAYEEGLEIYRKVLFEAWVDGATTASEKEQLESLRSSLMITPADHARLEHDAKIDAYTHAFRRAWSSGAISPESASLLAELRRKFSISVEEHEEIEATLLWELRSASQKAQIMVIDDDQKLLTVISDSLQDAGFQTIPVTTTDEAFKILQTTTPDLILSDINLETSTMGGFSFYEKVREIERLHAIPFIFLSGLTDEVLIRTGKELGVDDYITKPFSHESLIASIKGKLKRYRQMKKKT